MAILGISIFQQTFCPPFAWLGPLQPALTFCRPRWAIHPACPGTTGVSVPRKGVERWMELARKPAPFQQLALAMQLRTCWTSPAPVLTAHCQPYGLHRTRPTIPPPFKRRSPPYPSHCPTPPLPLPTPTNTHTLHHTTYALRPRAILRGC